MENFEHFKQSIMDTRAALIVADYIKEHLDAYKKFENRRIKL